MNINFYLLPALDLREWQYNACLLAEQAYQRAKTVYLQMESPAHAQQLNALMWCYNEGIVLPHQTYSPPGNCDDIPIQIGHALLASCPQADILINMSAVIPDCYSQFGCIIELVPQQSQRRQQARDKYRFYQRQGCQVVTKNVSGKVELPEI